MRVLIFQILGRFKDYEQLRFTIDGHDFSSLLSSFAIKDYYERRGEKCDVFLLVRESL